MIAALLLVLALEAPADSSAMAADSSQVRPVLTLPETRVDSARPVRGARDRQPTAFVSEIRAGSTGHALETIPELLSRTAAVRIQQYGGLGSYATVSLRGAPAGQVSIFVDGVPLTSAAGSVVNINDLPITAIDRLEVYPGVSPLELGPPTPGGAINVITLAPAPLARLKLLRGSFDTWEGVATAGTTRGAWSALVHGGYQGTGGGFGYWDDNGTPLNPQDDAASIRQNNRFDSRTVLGTLKGPLPARVLLTLKQSVFNKAQGVPGLGAIPAQSTRLALERSITTLEFERPGAQRMPLLHANMSFDRARTRFRDRLGELGAGIADTDDRFSGEQVGVRAVAPLLSGGVRLEATAQRHDERAELRDAASGRPAGPVSHRTTQGVSVRILARPIGERLLLVAGRRWDRQRDALRWTSSLGVASGTDRARELDAPQLGLQWRVLHALDLKANWSKSARAPEFLELFGNEGSVRGNPQLTPERSENWDLGSSLSFTRFRTRGRLEFAHYEQHARDLITYARNSASSVRALNVSRARIHGEELSASLHLPKGVSVSGWCVWQSTLDQGNAALWRGRHLPQRPERQLFGELRWRTHGLELAGEWERLGEDYMDRANRLRVPARTFTGASIGAPLLPGTRVVFEAKNLENVRVADVAGFPLPGRSFFLSCAWDGIARAPIALLP